MEENAIFAVTIIEIRPFRNGWQVYEAPAVQPVFLSQEQAIALLSGGQSYSVRLINWEFKTLLPDPTHAEEGHTTLRRVAGPPKSVSLNRSRRDGG